jgi:hypothetical protein
VIVLHHAKSGGGFSLLSRSEGDSSRRCSQLWRRNYVGVKPGEEEALGRFRPAPRRSGGTFVECREPPGGSLASGISRRTLRWCPCWPPCLCELFGDLRLGRACGCSVLEDTEELRGVGLRTFSSSMSNRANSSSTNALTVGVISVSSSAGIRFDGSGALIPPLSPQAPFQVHTSFATFSIRPVNGYWSRRRAIFNTAQPTST